MTARDPAATALAQLARAPASDVKRLGWRGVMKAVRRDGRLLVTNHDEPEAVILSLEEFTELAEAARAREESSELAVIELQQQFDRRLAALAADDAGDRLREVARRPAKMRGKVKAGASH